MKRVLISIIGLSALLAIIGIDLRSTNVQSITKQSTNTDHRFFDAFISNQSLLIVTFAVIAISLLAFALHEIKHEQLDEKENSSLLISGF